MKENDVLRSIVTGMFSKTDDEVASLIFNEDGSLKEDADTVILGMSSTKIKRIQEDATKGQQTFFDNGYSKAKGEELKKVEKKFLEITGFSTDKTTFDEMVAEYAASKKSSVTPDDIKKNPLYLELERNAVPKTKYETLEKEYTEFKANQERAKVINVVKSKAWDITSGRNPILGDNPAVASTRKDDFLGKLDGYDYEVNDSNILVLKDGKRVEDQQGNALSFESHVNHLADRNFDFQKQNKKDSAGNETHVPTVSGEPKTREEYNSVLASNMPAKDRVEYMNTYKDKFAQ